jgi:hypothetical protein
VGTWLAVSCLIPRFGDGRLVGMYLRTTQRRNKDGSVVRYVQLAHNRRVEGVTQAEVLLNLGRDETAGALSSEGSGGQVTMTAGGPSGGWSGPRKGVIPALHS